MNPTNDPSAESTIRERQYGEFVMLLTRHDLTLRRFVRTLLPSRDGVDDVVQETALECWKKYSEFQPSSSAGASSEFVRWACVIARFKAMSWQRDKSRERLVFRESVVELLAKDSLEWVGKADHEREAVEHCLQSLPEDQRRLVLSVHSPGESIARIAEETGVKARRLYSRVHALRTLLFECVKHQLGEEAAHG